LSGGERKRATISEAMLSRGSIACWDCSTRGLDAGMSFFLIVYFINSNINKKVYKLKSIF